MIRAGVIVAVVCALTGCSARSVELPPAGTLSPPTFPPVVADPVDSPQLDALVERDRSGLAPPPPAAGELLGPALAALDAELPAVTELIRVSVYDDSVDLAVVDPTNADVAISGSYGADGVLRLFDGQVVTDESYPRDAIDPAVPAAAAAAVTARFPSLSVPSYDLRRGLSYDFGLAWYLKVDDAAGDVGTVFVDPDGTVVGVDLR